MDRAGEVATEPSHSTADKTAEFDEAKGVCGSRLARLCLRLVLLAGVGPAVGGEDPLPSDKCGCDGGEGEGDDGEGEGEGKLALVTLELEPKRFFRLSKDFFRNNLLDGRFDG